MELADMPRTKLNFPARRVGSGEVRWLLCSIQEGVSEAGMPLTADDILLLLGTHSPCLPSVPQRRWWLEETHSSSPDERRFSLSCDVLSSQLGAAKVVAQ